MLVLSGTGAGGVCVSFIVPQAWCEELPSLLGRCRMVVLAWEEAQPLFLVSFPYVCPEPVLVK
eukprot:COSAG06_NODE_65549_length_256_cov_1.726115_1_plen_63_part_00